MVKAVNRSVWLARCVFVLLLIAATVAFFWQEPINYRAQWVYMDKFLHFSIFFILAFSVDRGFSLRPVYSLLALIAYGVAVEWVQYYLPVGRSDIYDLLADIGGILSYFGLRWILKKR